MIKKILLFLCALTALFFANGCGDKIMVNGEYYSILSPAEERKMVDFARATICSNFKTLSPATRNFILTTEPKITLEYFENRGGYAVYEWIFGDLYLYRVSCRGKFLTQNLDVKVISQRLIEDIDDNGKKRGNVTFQPFKEQ